MQLYLVWFGMVWLKNLKKETLNQKNSEGKMAQNQILYRPSIVRVTETLYPNLLSETTTNVCL